MPVNQLSVSDAKSILKAFGEVFDQCSLWTAGDRQWMMAGVKNPKESEINDNFGRLWDDPVSGPEMRSLGFASAEQFGAHFIADGPRLKAWVAGSLPLTDNYPHRLSRKSYKTAVADAHAFNDFKDSEDSRKTFMTSKDIGKIWPDALRKKTEKHFSVRQAIISLLALHRFQRLPLVKELHGCIDNPLLADYTLWAFGSEQYAQDIIDQVLRPSSERLFDGVEAMELNLHLAARAAAHGKYLESENYLRLVTEEKGLQDINVSILEIRMYLLYLAGEKKRALQVKDSYINYREEGREERRKSMDDYWRWLTEATAK